MLSARAWLRLWCFCVPVFGQPASDLAALKEKVTNDLTRLPDYLCRETVERSTRRPRSRGYEQQDRFRLEVGYLGGNEVFGWPGGDRLTVEDISQMVAGTVSNGDFALLVQALFSSQQAEFSAPEEELRESRVVLRYNYRVPLPGSSWVIRIPGQEATVAYHGFIRVDRERLDLLEMETVADDIPRSLGYRTVERTLRFSRVQVGQSEFLLPASAVMRSTDLQGEETRNDIRFEGCHQYAAESTLRFDDSDTPSPAPTAAAAVPLTPLPAEFEADIELEEKIDTDLAAAGDPFTAILRQAITEKGATVLPKGARLHGRIVAVPLLLGRRGLDLTFLFFEAGSRRVDIHARANRFAVQVFHLRDGGALPYGPSGGNTIRTGVTVLKGPLFAEGNRLLLPAGFRLQLTSRQP